MSAVNNRLTIPEGKYLLGDAGYSSSYRVLTPYRGIRYHLQETAISGQRPRTPEELYNLRHSQARIIVEMAIGWHKATFKILTGRPTYPVVVQNGIVFATAGLLNWIKEYGGRDAGLPIEPGWYPDLGPPAIGSVRGPGMELSRQEMDGTENGTMYQLREMMAADMWHQYSEYRRRNGYDDEEIADENVDSEEGMEDESDVNEDIE